MRPGKAGFDIKDTRATISYAFRKIIWPRKYLLLFGFVLVTVNRLSGLVLPGAGKFLMDDVIVPGNLSLLRTLLIVVSCAVVVQAVTSFFLTRIVSVQAQHLISVLRTDVQEHILHLPVRYFDNTKSGELVSRIMQDATGVRNLVGTGLVHFFGGILTAIVAFIILITINPLMTLYTLVPLAIFGVVATIAFRKIRPIFRERGRINAEVTGRLIESLNGIRVIKGFNAERYEVAVFEAGAERLFRNVRKSLTATSLMTSSSVLLLGLASVVIMGLGGTMIVKGEMTVGEFFAFTLYLGFLIAPIVQMSSIGSQLMESMAGLDRMEEVLKMAREDEDAGRTEVLEDVTGRISFQDVSFAYDQEKGVLSNISFEAPAGTVTALVGSSGSGKTTIAGLAASFMKPDRGRVLVDGIDLSRVKLDSYRRHLGVVLQDDFLFEGTIRDNILFPDPDAEEERLLNAVTAAHVSEFTDKFPDGLDTVIGERGVKLSGGQRQRVSIARALLADPRILILDEATSSLDTESELYIQESLARLLQNRTTFVIAHRLSTIRRADQILVIEKGKIVERGKHDELMAKEGRYHQLYTYQVRI